MWRSPLWWVVAGPGLVAIGTALGCTPASPPPTRMSLDTVAAGMAGDEASIPRHMWLDDGTLLLHDRRPPATERTLERLDPASGDRVPACDATAALASLRLLLADGEAPPAGLGWPDAVAGDGRHAAYLLAGDLFLLDLAQSEFARLTRTPEAEKNPVFSPDGHHLAFVRANNLVAITLATGAARNLTDDGGPTLLNGTLPWVYWEEIFGRRDTAFWWAPDSHAIAFLQSDEAACDEALQQEFEPANPHLIRQRYPRAGTTNPTVRVGVVGLDRKGPVWIDSGEPRPEWVVRVTWLPDSRRLAVQTMPRSQRRLDLLLADGTTGASRRILSETSDTFVNTHDDLHFVADGRRLLWASERSGRYRYGLFDLDGTLVRWLDLGDLVVRASSGVFWVKAGICAVDDTRHLVYFTATEGTPIAPALYRVSWDGGPPQRISPATGSHRISFDRQARYFLDEHSTVRTPPELTLHTADGDARAVVAEARGAAAEAGLQHAEFLTIPAADGFPLPARLYRPRDLDPATRRPLIVHVYGGPGAPQVHDAWDRNIWFANLLLARGFLHIEIDNRCATGLSKTLEDTVAGRLMAGGEIDDIVAAVRWLKDQSWVDPTRVGVWGWSGGGTLTLQLMTHCDEFRAGIAGAAVTDFRYYDSKIAEAYIGLPSDNPTGYAASAPARFAGDLSGRLLLIHGALDDNVQLQNAWRFAHELQQAGLPFELMIYPTAKHHVVDPLDHHHLLMTMADFWERSLR